jgi:hypothetical protein
MLLLILAMSNVKDSQANKMNNLKNTDQSDLGSLVEQFVFHDYVNQEVEFINNDYGKTAKRLIEMITVFADKTDGKFYVRLSDAYKKISAVTFDEDIAEVLVKECKRDILNLKSENLSILKVFRELVFHMSLSSLFDAENFGLKIKAKFGWKITDFISEYIYNNFTDLLARHHITEIAETPGLALWPSSSFTFNSSEDERETPGLNNKFTRINLDEN